MVLDLSDDEAAAVAQLLRRTINDDPYPLSPRLAPLKAILAKLNPPQPPPEPPPRRCNLRQVDRQTGFLLPPSVDEWLPERHLAVCG
jgi:hypothetical protein